MSCLQPRLVISRSLWIRLVRRDRRYSLRRTIDSLIHIILDDTSDIDIPLAVLASRHQKQRRAALMEKPRRRSKGKAKAKADKCDSVDMDASREDIASGG